MRRQLWFFDLAIYFAVAVYLAAHPQRSGRYAVGMAIVAIGLGLWIVARLQLGNSFAVRAKATALVTTGLYSRLRHPVYCFGQIAMFGLVIASGIWWLLIPVMLSIPMQYARMRKEDAVLATAFGDQYTRYRAQTWF